MQQCYNSEDDQDDCKGDDGGSPCYFRSRAERNPQGRREKEERQSASACLDAQRKRWQPEKARDEKAAYRCRGADSNAYPEAPYLSDSCGGVIVSQRHGWNGPNETEISYGGTESASLAVKAF